MIGRRIAEVPEVFPSYQIQEAFTVLRQEDGFIPGCCGCPAEISMFLDFLICCPADKGQAFAGRIRGPVLVVNDILFIQKIQMVFLNFFVDGVCFRPDTAVDVIVNLEVVFFSIGNEDTFLVLLQDCRIS